MAVTAPIDAKYANNFNPLDLVSPIPVTGLTKAVTSGIFKGWLADLLNVGRTGKRLQLPKWYNEFLTSLFDVAKGTENLLGARHVRILESPIFNDVAFFWYHTTLFRSRYSSDVCTKKCYWRYTRITW